MSAPPSQTRIPEAMQAFLKAIASDTRQRILLLFVDDQHLSVGQIAERADLGASTASEHLAILREAGLLQATRDGKTVFYRVDGDHVAHHVAELGDFLTRCCPPAPDH